MAVSVNQAFLAELEKEVLINAFVAQFGFLPPTNPSQLEEGELSKMVGGIEVCLLAGARNLNAFAEERPGATSAIRVMKINLERGLVLLAAFPHLRPPEKVIKQVAAAISLAGSAAVFNRL